MDEFRNFPHSKSHALPGKLPSALFKGAFGSNNYSHLKYKKPP
jgi:hypothetical protein